MIEDMKIKWTELIVYIVVGQKFEIALDLTTETYEMYGYIDMHRRLRSKVSHSVFASKCFVFDFLSLLILEHFTYDTVCDAISWPSAYKFCTWE